MNLDVTALGTFYRMAEEGAGFAAGRLTHMTDIETRVGVTTLHFMRSGELRRDFAGDNEQIGVHVDLEGAIDGDSIIVFDREAADRVIDVLLEESGEDIDPALRRSAVQEVGGIMNNGFVDGWADVLETAIDVSPPTLIEGSSADPFVDHVTETPDDDDLVLLFGSAIEAVGTEIGFRHYLFPEHDSMARLLAQLRTGEGIPFEQLEGFDRMAERGAAEVAKTATTLTGIETNVEIRRLNFVALEALPEDIDDEEVIGVAFEFEGTPSGYLLFVFDETSANDIVNAMIPGDGGPESGAELGAMGESAIQELANIMASGMLDGWANVLDTTIDHSPPELIQDIGPAAIDPLVIELGEQQDYAFVFDTEVVADGAAFDCQIYAITEQDDLERALRELELDRIEDAETEATFEDIEHP